MVSRIFLDANFILEFLLKRKNLQYTQQIFLEITNGRYQAFITPSVLHIVAHWITKEFGSRNAKKILLILLKDLQVIDCTHDTALNALNSRFDDIEDALQYYTALDYKIDVFLSFDKKLTKDAIPQLPVFNPIDFLTN